MSSFEYIYSNDQTEQPKRHASHQLSLFTISSLSVGFLLWVWWAVTYFGVIEPLFLPSPQAVLERGWVVLTQGYMGSSLW